jgi:hypothetical protein
MMPYEFRNLAIPYKGGATNSYHYDTITDTGDYLYSQTIYKCTNAWSMQGIFTYLKAGVYTISCYIKSPIVRTVTLGIGLDNNMVSQYASTEVKNNLAEFGETFAIIFDTIGDNEWHRYNGQVEVTKSGYTMPRFYPRTDDSNYVFFSCLQLELGTEMTMFEGYHSTWYIDDNGELTHTNFIEIPNRPFRLPLPISLWNVDESINDGYPSNGFLPEIPTVGAFGNATALQRSSIPMSVGYIGSEAFKKTSITDVTISQNCTYYNTTFPEDCTINFYP